MATSGTATFNLTRNDICEKAARKVGALRSGAVMNPTMLAEFASDLNVMVKAWQGTGLHVWTVAEGILFPAVDQVRYALAKTGADNATNSYVETYISADEASGQTTISLGSTSSITAADNIGIVLDDGTIQWSTVTSKTSTTVLIPSAITDSASEDNPVFTYTAKITRPLKIVDVRRYDIASARETPITLLSRLDYQALPNKSSSGTINQAFYDPSLSTGYLYLWLGPVTTTDLVKFTYWRPIEDFNAAGDNPDFPVEWAQAMIFNLALNKCTDYDVPGDKVSQIASLAAMYIDTAAGFDREAESVTFGVDMS